MRSTQETLLTCLQLSNKQDKLREQVQARSKKALSFMEFWGGRKTPGIKIQKSTSENTGKENIKENNFLVMASAPRYSGWYSKTLKSPLRHSLVFCTACFWEVPLFRHFHSFPAMLQLGATGVFIGVFTNTATRGNTTTHF